MHGFHTYVQFRQHRLTGKQSAAVSLTAMAVLFSLCFTSGCAMTRKAWSGVHEATCGESASECSCTCGESLAGGTGYHEMPPHSSRPVLQPYAVTPRPPEGSRPIEHEIPPQTITMNGVQGIWTPAPTPVNPGVEHQHSGYVENSIAPWPETEAVTTSPNTMRYFPPAAQQTQSPPMHIPPANRPDATPGNVELQECRTQVQILAEQLLQMKNEQESIKMSQDSMQQLHERELLEIKLQHATADRDRLQREHELEQQLEQQRQRELETMDSLSEIIDGVAPAPAAPSAAIAPLQRPTSQSRQVRSAASQSLPTVDEGT